MESLLDRQRIGIFNPGVKKALVIFSLLWIVPLLVLGIVSYSIHDIEVLENWDFNFFLMGYFMCTATGSLIFVSLLKKWKQRRLQSLCISTFGTWLLVFIYDALYSNAIFGHADIRTSAKRAILGVAVVAVGIFLIKLSMQPRRDVNFEFRLNFWKYAKFAVFIALIQGLFIGGIFLVELWDKSSGLISMYMFGSVFYGLLSAMTALFVLFALTGIKFLRSQTLLLVFLTFVACVIVGTFYGIGVLRHMRKMQILVIGLFPAFFTASAMVFLLMQRSSAREQEQKFRKLDSSLSRRNSEYLELRQQTNPHFFFNNLNMLLGLVESDPEKALVFGRTLANVYRKFLKPDDQDFVSLSEEMAFVSEYLEIYRAKFGNSFSLSIDVKASDGDYILAHSLQEIIDNIFKHNILDNEHPITIGISTRGKSLVITNTVRARQHAESAKTGLSNIGRRYELLCEKRMSLIGTTSDFTVYLPILAIE
ncbi:sensor histidine kinase [Flavobacterium selenitireducens]|uniref:sensor histidine kinase n=1 Tax=Flavobacterium selenitireducens TaxID=2722704 RepID=UPI00168A6DB0|nr:sensor histidine kinase [Flavobacterium selenitireducens]MBD3581131.1 histidine kinase [Flavobacterium selenitireducens]